MFAQNGPRITQIGRIFADLIRADPLNLRHPRPMPGGFQQSLHAALRRPEPMKRASDY